MAWGLLRRLPIVIFGLAGGIVLTGCTPTTPQTTPSAAQGTATTSSRPTSLLPSPSGSSLGPSTSASASLFPLGPAGHGGLKLGQSLEQAVRTGLLTVSAATQIGLCGAPGGTGQDGRIVGAKAGTGIRHTDGAIFFSAQHGLVAIYAFPGVTTPEGIGIGTPFDQMVRAYPDWNPVPFPGTAHDGRGGVKVPGNPNAHYRMVVQRDVVVQLSLGSNNQNCYE